MKKVEIQSFDGLKLKGYLFSEVKNPIGVIQIIHGMQEHGMRYEQTAGDFNNAGFIVFVSDSRGHGKTAENLELLGRSDGDIFSETVQDQVIISEYLVAKFNLPLYVIGHSYGSFIAQRYIQVCNLSKKVVICGTTDGDNLIMKFGKIIAWFTEKKNGKHGKATLIENMSLKGYCKGFENGNWLSRDEKVWEAYTKDEYCGTPFPVSFYRSLFRNMGKLNKGIKDIPLTTRILLIAGENDPVGSKGKEVKKLHNKYIKNCLNAKLKLYPEARHELFNETNRDEVIIDVIKFLKED